MAEPKIYHRCIEWTFQSGPSSECPTCSYREKKPRRKPARPRYTYEEAIERIDICAGCGGRISEDSRHHHCEACLPAWLERIAKINAAQERGEGDWNVG